jgi:hypothetical protein
MRQSFDDYNETCQMIDGSAAIHPHKMGLLMLRGISSSCQYGQAKLCAIHACDTDYLLSADEVWLAYCMWLRIWRRNFLSPSTKHPTLLL